MSAWKCWRRVFVFFFAFCLLKRIRWLSFFLLQLARTSTFASFSICVLAESRMPPLSLSLFQVFLQPSVSLKGLKSNLVEIGFKKTDLKDLDWNLGLFRIWFDLAFFLSV